jgi:hypothetical protein
MMNMIPTNQYLTAGLLTAVLLLPAPTYADSCPKHQANGIDKSQLVESPRMQSDFNPSATARPTFEVWASLAALAWVAGWLLYMKPAAAPGQTERIPATPMNAGERHAPASGDETAQTSPIARRRCPAMSPHTCAVPRFGDRTRPRRSSRIGSYAAAMSCSLIPTSLHPQCARGATTRA